jgi:hypothetical protein
VTSLGVPRGVERRDDRRALADQGVPQSVDPGELVIPDAQETSMQERQGVGWPMGAELPAGSRERPVEADSNLVSVEAWQQAQAELLPEV